MVGIFHIRQKTRGDISKHVPHDVPQHKKILQSIDLQGLFVVSSRLIVIVLALIGFYQLFSIYRGLQLLNIKRDKEKYKKHVPHYVPRFFYLYI